MTFEIEIGPVGGKWRAAARAEGEPVAEAWGVDEASARANLMAMLGAGHARPTAQPGTASPPPIATPSSMNGTPLRDAITAVLSRHAELRLEDRVAPKTAKMDRYRTARGRGIAHDHNNSVQHLWVAADGLPSSLDDLPKKFYAGGQDGKGRHSNLKAIPDLGDADLMRFSPRTAEEAQRIVDAVTPLPPTAA